MNQNRHNFPKEERDRNGRILRLVGSDLKGLERIFLKILRVAWRHQPAPTESVLEEETNVPTGPYAANRRRQMGDLLLWVPRKIDSFIIDDLTGRFGYSHLSVDTGEVDLPTGKPVMVEAMVGKPVQRKFQDEYAGRNYARIPLSKTGIDAETFVGCIKSELGEPYDNLEALTLGEIDDPAKQVCSGLAAECLPETVRKEIAKARRLRLLRGTSVSVHSSFNAPKTKVFISPNGFAEYYAAPKGRMLQEADLLVEPHPMDTSMIGVVRRHASKAVWFLGVVGVVSAVVIFFIFYENKPKND
jgi:hypothetical protein